MNRLRRLPAMLVALLVLAVLVVALPAAGAGSTGFVFELPRAATTSAGVFAADGRLLRTLWRGVPLAAGRHQRHWDGLDDRGRPAPAGEAEIRVLHHRVQAVWEGVIGNSSASFTGPGVHRAYRLPSALAVEAGQVYYAVGYNEGLPGVHRFDNGRPGVAIPIPATIDPFVGAAMIAVDAGRLYWASTGGLAKQSFVGLVDLASGRRAAFPAGQDLCLNRFPGGLACYESQQYKGVIDLQADAADLPTGLAVQPAGRVLAVAHGGRQRIHLFDKHSGQALGRIELGLAAGMTNQIAMAADGALWVISGGEVLRFADLERRPTLTATITGLDRPLALAAVPGRPDEVWVALGGPQQLRRLDAQGRTLVSIGRPGGQRGDPAVSPEALCFTPGQREQAALAATDERSVWVVDGCHNRLLRFSADAGERWRMDAQIAYLPHSYAAAVDPGQPRRVFSNFLEFEVDDAPLKPGEGSWRLVRNWLAGLPAELVDEHSSNGGFGGFESVQTLASGRTYGMLVVRGQRQLVELPAAGPLRRVRTLPPPPAGQTAPVLYENGELGHATSAAGVQTVWRLPLLGDDEQGQPRWAAVPRRIAAAAMRADSPHYRGAFSGTPPRFPLTASQRVVFFDQSVQGNEGFHLGAVAQGGSDWLWQASPSGPMDGRGGFQTRAVDQSVQYGGNAVWALGRHIVYGYHGEFYRDLQNGRVGQAGQFMHFDESGLFINQFGLPTTRSSQPAEAGASGNAFRPTLVRSGGRLFLYHNDESVHGGVHRWRIDGEESIAELRGRVRDGSTTQLR